MTDSTPRSFGWLNDLTSLYDYTVEHPDIKPLLSSVTQQRLT